MSVKKDINLVALEIKKWDLETQKITTISYFVLDNNEESLIFDVSILPPPEMVEEYLGKLRFEAAQKLQNGLGEEVEVDFDNETFLRQKIYNYFKRINSELNNPRRKKGQSRMIFTTHMDVYNENQDVSFLPSRLQFFVVLNWARKHYEREDYKKAVEPLRKLIKVDPGFGKGYQWLARSLKKIRKYDEAMRFYEKYAEVENTTEAWLDLAKSYRKGKLFDQSEKIYQRILKEEPQNMEARIGIAQIRYANNNLEYLEILDALYKENPEWTRQWLVEEFNFRIYNGEKQLLSPVQAAKFLGFSRIFDLTQKAFKNEVPSHFNPSKARLSFYKEELENWANIMNRFQCLPEPVQLFPEKISQAEGDSWEAGEENDGDTAASSQTEKPSVTKVEDILKHIRARKAQRMAEQNANQVSQNGSKDKKKSGGSTRTKKGSKNHSATAERKTRSKVANKKG